MLDLKTRTIIKTYFPHLYLENWYDFFINKIQ
jgi:hypothetical protein